MPDRYSEVTEALTEAVEMQIEMTHELLTFWRDSPLSDRSLALRLMARRRWLETKWLPAMRAEALAAFARRLH